MPTSAELLSDILTACNEGRLVAFGTALRVTTFTPKAVAKIRASGLEPFKLGSDGSVWMLAGWKNRKPVFVTITLANGMLLGGLHIESARVGGGS